MNSQTNQEPLVFVGPLDKAAQWLSAHYDPTENMMYLLSPGPSAGEVIVTLLASKSIFKRYSGG